MTQTTLITGEITKRLAEAGVRTSKKLGQNFLVNQGVYEKIVSALSLSQEDTVVEVGPGLGTLTDHLVGNVRKIIAVEKDLKLVEYLKKRYKNTPEVEIIGTDILKFNPTEYSLKDGEYTLVGNIPYYLTSHLFKIIFDSTTAGWPRPKLIVFMVQKEVAQRIVAKPPKMSLLAVSIQYYSTPEIISYVSKGNFFPAPKVDSAIIKLIPHTLNSIPSTLNLAPFFRVVKAGFSNKRKQLLNNLSSGLKIPKADVTSKLLLSDIAPERRAETLTIVEWQKITDTFFGQD